MWFSYCKVTMCCNIVFRILAHVHVCTPLWSAPRGGDRSIDRSRDPSTCHSHFQEVLPLSEASMVLLARPELSLPLWMESLPVPDRLASRAQRHVCVLVTAFLFQCWAVRTYPLLFICVLWMSPECVHGLVTMSKAAMNMLVETFFCAFTFLFIFNAHLVSSCWLCGCARWTF